MSNFNICVYPYSHSITIALTGTPPKSPTGETMWLFWAMRDFETVSKWLDDNQVEYAHDRSARSNPNYADPVFTLTYYFTNERDRLLCKMKYNQ